jgi:hypothetical protein
VPLFRIIRTARVAQLPCGDYAVEPDGPSRKAQYSTSNILRRHGSAPNGVAAPADLGSSWRSEPQAAKPSDQRHASWDDASAEPSTPGSGGVAGGTGPPIVPSLKLPSSMGSPGSACKPFIPKLALRDTTQDALRAPLTRSSRRQSFRIKGSAGEGEAAGAAPVSMSFTMRFGTPAATVRELASTRTAVASDTQARSSPGPGYHGHGIVLSEWRQRARGIFFGALLWRWRWVARGVQIECAHALS